MPASGKDKAIGGRAAQPKPSTSQTKPGKSDKSTPKSQNADTANVSDLCVLCQHAVEEENDAMQCSFCKEFTHRTCDGRISESLYNSLVHDVNNVLLYLCIKCKPMILPEDSSGLWKTFLGRVEKCFQDIPKREPLADKIMNSLSSKIELLHGVTREYQKNLEEAHATLAASQISLSDSQKALTDSQTEMRALVERMHTQRQTLTGNNQQSSVEDQGVQNMSIGTQTNQPMPAQSNIPPLNRPPPNMPPPPLSSLNCMPTPALMQNLPQFPNSLPHMLYPPLFQTSQPRPFPPQMQNHFPGPQRLSEHVARPNSHHDHFQSPVRRPYHDTPAPPAPDVSKPNTDTTVIVYNTDKSKPPGQVTEDLMLKCKLFRHEIEFTGNLIRSATNKSPLYINCNSRATKWMFLRELNQLRTRYTEYKDMYARPYMTEEQLKTDRNLVRQLVDLRNRYPQRIFKIQRGEIKEKVGHDYVVYSPNPYVADVSTSNDSFNSMPDLENIVQAAREVQNQSTPAHSSPGQRSNGSTDPNLAANPQQAEDANTVTHTERSVTNGSNDQ